MGANQSSGEGQSGVDKEKCLYGSKTCYYELLGIDAKASEDDIRKAYHRKALELHPDRNFGHVAAATDRFASIQSAYEVLSDPQERAWYDNHRESILGGSERDGVVSEHNAGVTTADDIIRFFSKVDFRIDSLASSTGVFVQLNDFFDRLAKEEEIAFRVKGLDAIQYPCFGHREASYEDIVRPFYVAWSGFGTAKSFSWKDHYRYSEAPDRKVRRMMEKENRHLRDAAIREFNDAVRSLVAFVRRRDPRSISSKRSEEDRQKVLRDAAVAQAVRSRTANQAKLAAGFVPEWTKPTASEPYVVSDDEQTESDIAKQQFECIVCSKSFKSEKQYDAHERSKKHNKAVKQLRHEMQLEDRGFSLNGPGETHIKPLQMNPEMDVREEDEKTDSIEEADKTCDWKFESESISKAEGGDFDARVSPQAQSIPIVVSTPDKTLEDDLSSDRNLEHSLSDGKHKVESGRDEIVISDLQEALIDATVTNDIETFKKPKIGKAKEKRAKKAAQKLAMSDEVITCAVCRNSFTSKTQLFKHVKTVGHARVTESSHKS